MKTSMTYKLLLGVIALTLSACGELEKAAKDLQDEVDDRTNGGDKKEQVLKYSDVYTKVLQGRYLLKRVVRKFWHCPLRIRK